jgi:serine phosphatase RsbU (regulator of sigma subunit)
MVLSVRWKLFAALTVPLLAAGSAAGGAGVHQMRAARLAALEGELQDLAVHLADRIDARLRATEEVARGLAAALAAGAARSEDSARFLARAALERTPLVEGVAVTLAPGSLAARRGAWVLHARRATDGVALEEGGPEAPDRGQPAEGAAPRWTPPRPEASAGGALRVRFDVPVGAPARPVGSVAIELAPETLLARLAPQAADRYRHVVVDGDGRFVSHPDPALVGTQSIQGLARELELPELVHLAALLGRREPGVMRLGQFGTPEPHWVSFAPLRSTGWMLAVAAPESELLGPSLALQREALLVLALLLAALTALAFVTSARFTRPLRRMVAVAEELTAADPGSERRFGGDELGRLAAALFRLGRTCTERGAALQSRERTEQRDAEARARLIEERNSQTQARARLEQEREQESREYRRVVRERDEQAALAAGLASERDTLTARLAQATQALSGLREDAATARRLAWAIHEQTLPAPYASRDVEACALVVRGPEPSADFVDFFPVAQDRIVMVSADAAAGRGAGAELAGPLRLLVRRLAQRGETPARLLAQVSAALAEAGGGTVSLGLFVASLAPETGELSYSNAGHPRPLWVDGQGAMHRLGEVRGRPAGERSEATYAQGIATLTGGECLILAAQGAVSGTGPADGPLAPDPLRRVMADAPRVPAQALCHALADALAAGPGDERAAGAAVLVVRRPPGPAGVPGGEARASRWRRLGGLGRKPGHGV